MGGLVLVTVVSALCHLTYAWISEDNWMLFYLVSVILAALFWGEGPAVLVAFLSFLMLDLGVFTPRFQLGPVDAQYLISLGTFIFVALIISNLSNRVRRQAREARRKERHTAALYAFTRSLATAEPDKGRIAQAFREHGSQACGVDLQLILEPQEATEADRGAVTRCLQEGQRTSRGETSYWPLSTPRGILGVARLAQAVPVLEQPLLSALCTQAALALEHVDATAQARQAEVLAATERLQSALLSSLSHDLHTPLASISGSLQVLRDQALSLDDATRTQMLELAQHQTGRLQRLVSNLLQITRFEGGVQLNREPCDLSDLLGSAVLACGGSSRVRIHMDPELGEVPLDFVLVSQVLGNLLENALKYSPDGSLIELTATLAQSELELKVEDRGCGIPEPDLARVFERFYRAERGAEVGGSGLGLSISRAIVEAHGGRIWAENRAGGGTRLLLRLPVEGKDV